MASEGPRQRLSILFRKADGARFLSHLDLLATLEYGMRRARLPLALSEGFNPRPRMSLAAPLPVGYVGEREILEISLKEPRDPAEVQHALQAALPAGITVLEVTAIEPERKGAASRLRGAVYRIDFPHPAGGLAGNVKTLLARETIEVDETRGEGTRTRDLRPLIDAIEVIDPSSIRLSLRLTDAGSARPEQIVELLGIDPDGVRYVRERLDVSG